MELLKIDACYAAVIHLAEKLAEVGAALMPNPCFGEESGGIACFYYAITEVDILAKTHLGKSIQMCIDLTTNTHVERTGIELVEFGFATADAAGGKKTRHRVGN